MKNGFLLFGVAAAILATLSPCAVLAQDPFGFDVVDEFESDEPDTTVGDATPNATAEPATAIALPTDVMAVINAIQDSNPTSPEQLMRATDQLIRLGQPDVAKEYLDRLTALSLDDEALAKLYEEFGTAVLIRLARTSELAPAAKSFAFSVMHAARRLLEDPDRLRQLSSQLVSQDRAERQRAAAQLLRAGPYAVAALIAQLASDNGASPQRAQWPLAVLRRLGTEALEPLYGLRESSDVAVRIAVFKALAVIGAPESLPYLIGPMLSSEVSDDERRVAAAAWQRILPQQSSNDEAVTFLRGEADRAYAGSPGSLPDAEGFVIRWIWSADDGLRPVRLRSDDAAILKATRLYTDLVQLRPEDVEARQRLTVGQLTIVGVPELEATQTTEMVESIKQSGAWQLSQCLQLALDDAHDIAAAQAAQLLGTLGDVSVLQRSGVDPAAATSPLGQALTHADRRVRFAAAEAVAKLRPGGSFDGAGRLADVLEYFATSRGERAAVVGHPNRAMAQSLAGMLQARGFRVAAVTSASDVEAAASATADAELILLSDAVNDLSVWSAIERLRVNPRTARLPIAILVRPTTRDESTRIAGAHERVLVFSETPDDATIDVELPRLMGLASLDAVEPSQRRQEAQAALEMLNDLIRNVPAPELDLAGRADRLVSILSSDDVLPESIDVLAMIPAPQAQSRLMELASEQARPLKLRQSAADNFRASVSQFGMLFSAERVQLQYDRYNQSRQLDQDTQRLLGSILDTIEATTTPVPSG